MKATKRHLFILAICLLGACSADYTPPADAPVVSKEYLIARGDLSFGHEGGQAEIAIESNSRWTVSIDAAWAAASVTEGEGSRTVTVSVMPSEELSPRTAILKVTTTKTPPPQIITISQEAHPEDPFVIPGADDNLPPNTPH